MSSSKSSSVSTQELQDRYNASHMTLVDIRDYIKKQKQFFARNDALKKDIAVLKKNDTVANIVIPVSPRLPVSRYLRESHPQRRFHPPVKPELVNSTKYREWLMKGFTDATTEYDAHKPMVKERITYLKSEVRRNIIYKATLEASLVDVDVGEYVKSIETQYIQREIDDNNASSNINTDPKKPSHKQKSRSRKKQSRNKRSRDKRSVNFRKR